MEEAGMLFIYDTYVERSHIERLSMWKNAQEKKK